MVQSIHVRSYRPFALFLILSLLLLISGCRGPTPSAFDAADLESGVHRQETTPAPEAVTEILPTTDAAGYVGIESFEKPLEVLAGAAEKLGFAAACVYPDQQSRQQFLVVAPDHAAAERMNGFFCWLLDPEVVSQQDPGLSLCIDRLFDEKSRPAALANKSYSDPRVVGLLTQSLSQILGVTDVQAILDFVLTSYREDYARRLIGNAPTFRTRQFVWKHIEVTYEDSIISTVWFRAIEGSPGNSFVDGCPDCHHHQRTGAGCGFSRLRRYPKTTIESSHIYSLAQGDRLADYQPLSRLSGLL